jgi:hypothetical protein
MSPIKARRRIATQSMIWAVNPKAQASLAQKITICLFMTQGAAHVVHCTKGTCGCPIIYVPMLIRKSQLAHKRKGGSPCHRRAALHIEAQTTACTVFRLPLSRVVLQ